MAAQKQYLNLWCHRGGCLVQKSQRIGSKWCGFMFLVFLGGVLQPSFVEAQEDSEVQEVTITIEKNPIIYRLEGLLKKSGRGQDPLVVDPVQELPDITNGEFAVLTGAQGCANEGLKTFWEEETMHPLNNQQPYYNWLNLSIQHILPVRSIPIAGHYYGDNRVVEAKTTITNLSDLSKLTAEQKQQLKGKVKMSLIYWTTALHPKGSGMAKTLPLKNSDFYAQLPELVEDGRYYSNAYLDAIAPKKNNKIYIYARSVQKAYERALKLPNPDFLTQDNSKKPEELAQEYKLGSKQARVFLPQVVGKKKKLKGSVARFNTIAYGMAQSNLSEFALLPVVDGPILEWVKMGKKDREDKPRAFNYQVLKAYESLIFNPKPDPDLDLDLLPWKGEKAEEKNSYSFTLEDDDRTEVPPVYVTHFGVQVCEDFQSTESQRVRDQDVQAYDVIYDLAKVAKSGKWEETRVRNKEQKVGKFYQKVLGNLENFSVEKHMNRFRLKALDLGLDSHPDMKSNYISAFYWIYSYIDHLKTQLPKIIDDVIKSSTVVDYRGGVEGLKVLSLNPEIEALSCNMEKPPEPTCSETYEDGVSGEIVTDNNCIEQKQNYREELEKYVLARKYCQPLEVARDKLKAYTQKLVYAAKDSTNNQMGISGLRLGTLNVSSATEGGKAGTRTNRNTLNFKGYPGTESFILDLKSVPTLYKAMSCFEIKNSLAKLYHSYKSSTADTNPLGKAISDVASRIMPDYVGNSHKWWEHTDIGHSCRYLAKELKEYYDDNPSDFTLFHRLTGLVFHEWGSGSNALWSSDSLTVRKFIDILTDNMKALEDIQEIVQVAMEIDNLEILLNLTPHYTPSCTYEVVDLNSENLPTSKATHNWGQLFSSAVLDTAQDFSAVRLAQTNYYSRHVEGDFAVNPVRDKAYQNPYYFIFASSSRQWMERSNLKLARPMIMVPGMNYVSPFIFEGESHVRVMSRPRAICDFVTIDEGVVSRKVDRNRRPHVTIDVGFVPESCREAFLGEMRKLIVKIRSKIIPLNEGVTKLTELIDKHCNELCACERVPDRDQIFKVVDPNHTMAVYIHN